MPNIARFSLREEMVCVDSKDPYVEGDLPVAPFVERRPVTGEVVAVLRGCWDDRALCLIPQPSRALGQGEIHEVILTDEDPRPGDKVDRIAYFAFVQIDEGGVALVGDRVRVGSGSGILAGFDPTHMPNHYNIIVRVRNCLADGEEQRLQLGDRMRIVGT